MRVLVIGGTRFVGAATVRRLAVAGHEVTVFHRGEHEARLPASVVQVRHPDAARPVIRIPDELRRSEPDVVLHMHAMGEADAVAAVRAFSGIARRLVVASSGDVYRAYGVFRRIEPGPVEHGALTEDAPLRRSRYPYRGPDTVPGQIEHDYDKLVVEEVVRSDPALSATVLRFPKLYGRTDNQDLSTVYGARHQPAWRWTHGYVENVAAATMLAVVDARAAGRIYNLGEAQTPTVGERLADLPPKPGAPLLEGDFDFGQDIHYDTRRIREELGFADVVDERVAMRVVAASAPLTVLPSEL